jgi:hypothetical protein
VTPFIDSVLRQPATTERLESTCLAFSPVAKRRPPALCTPSFRCVITLYYHLTAVQVIALLSHVCVVHVCNLYCWAAALIPNEEVFTLYVLLSLTLASSVVSRSVREIQPCCSHRWQRQTTLRQPCMPRTSFCRVMDQAICLRLRKEGSNATTLLCGADLAAMLISIRSSPYRLHVHHGTVDRGDCDNDQHSTFMKGNKTGCL